MKKTSFFITICLFTLLELFVTLPLARAAQTAVYNIPLFNEEQVLDNPTNQTSFWLELKPAIKPTGQCYAEIYYTASQTLLKEQSFLTIRLNDIPLTSRRISGKEGRYAVLRVPLPVQHLQQGFNELRITSNQRSSEGLCKDVDNSANWLVIGRQSFIHLEVEQNTRPDLGDYPYPFFDYLANKSANCYWHLPEKADREEIAAFLHMVSSWGARATNRIIAPIQVQMGQRLAASAHHILVGKLASWNVPNLPALPAGSGLLSLYGHPQTGTSLLVTGSDAAGLNRAVQVLADPQLTAQLQGDLVVLKDLPTTQSIQPAGLPGMYTFKQLGYSDLTVSGAFHQKASLTIRPQVNWLPGPDSYLEVHFRHARTLRPEKSVLTVQVNGRPVNSIPLTAANAEKGILKVPIPRAELSAPLWYVEFTLYHDLGVTDCSKLYDEVAWTVIENASRLYLAPGPAPNRPGLQEFPRLHLTPAEEKKAICWFPAPPAAQDLTLAALVALRAGQNTGSAVRWQVVIGARPSRKELEQYDVFLIARQGNWPALLQKNTALPVVPLEGDNFAIATGYNILPQKLSGATIIQCAPSPWAQGRTLYVLLNTPPSDYYNAGVILSDFNRSKLFGGEVVIIDRKGQVQSFTQNQFASPVNTPTSLWDKLFGGTTRGIFKIYAGITGLVLTAIAVSIWLVIKRSR